MNGGVTTYFPVQSVDYCNFKFGTLVEYSCGDDVINSEEIDCEALGLICINEPYTGSYCGEGTY